MEKVKRESSKLIKFFVLVIMMVTTLFTLAGCKLTNGDEPPVNAEFDAAGNPRVPTLSVDYSPYSQNGNSQIIDSKSGVFSFVIPYYFKGNLNALQEAYEADGYDLGTAFDYDQVSNATNFFYDEKLTQRYMNPGDFEVFYFDSATAIENYYTTSKLNSFYPDDGYTPVLEIAFTGAGFYSVSAVNESINPTSGIPEREFYVSKLYTYTTFLSTMSGFSIEDYFAFPELVFVVDGKEVEVKVDVNFNNLQQNIANKATLIEEKTTIDTTENPTLKFKYRKDYELVDAPTSMISYEFDETRGFVISFNPQLSKGSTTRTLKIKALTDDYDTINGGKSFRGNSSYSNNIVYQAYKLTFEAYSVNSSTIDYMGLAYDINNEHNNAYYFAETKTIHSITTGEDIVTSLVGYFPEGRQVKVSKTIDTTTGSSYAHQPWTTNEHAENTKFLNTLYSHAGTNITPDDLQYNKFASLPNFASTNELKTYMKTLFTNEVLRENDGFYVVTPKNGTGDITYFRPTTDVQLGDLFNLFFEDTALVSDSSLVSNTITVTSCNQTHNYKFFGNFAKVQNFEMSGNLHDGDNFFTSNDSALSGVTVSIYTEDGIQLTDNNSAPVEKTGNGTIEFVRANGAHGHNIKITMNGNEFSVSGLQYNERVYFKKIVMENSKSLPYEFYSANMTATTIYGSTQKCLTAQKGEKGEYVYTDKINNSIIGTKYENDTNLIVNVYTQNEFGFGNMLIGRTENFTDSNGNGQWDEGENFEDFNNNGEYDYYIESAAGVEIIKSTSSTVDKDGYVITNVIVSISVPSNATLIGYNLDMLQNSKKTLYTAYSVAGQPSIIHVVPFDTQNGEYNNDAEIFYTSTQTTFYSESEMEKPVRSADGKFYLYQNKAYTYDHSEGEFDYYQLVSTTNVYGLDEFSTIVVIRDDGDPQSIINYTKVTNAGFVVNSNGDFVVAYNGNYYEKSTEKQLDGEVHILTTGFKTDLEYKSESFIYEGYEITKDDTSAGAGQSVYAYYDTKLYSGNNERYLTAPIGKKLTITLKEEFDDTNKNGKWDQGEPLVSGTDLNSNGTYDANVTQTKDAYTWYYGNFSNIQTLITNGTVMLGSDVMTSNNTNAVNFRALVGAQLISYCYYYIKPLGAPTEIRVSQILGSVQIEGSETTTAIPNYKYNGTSYVGKVTSEQILSGAKARTTITIGNSTTSLPIDIQVKYNENSQRYTFSYESENMTINFDSLTDAILNNTYGVTTLSDIMTESIYIDDGTTAGTNVDKLSQEEIVLEQKSISVNRSNTATKVYTTKDLTLGSYTGTATTYVLEFSVVDYDQNGTTVKKLVKNIYPVARINAEGTQAYYKVSDLKTVSYMALKEVNPANADNPEILYFDSFNAIQSSFELITDIQDDYYDCYKSAEGKYYRLSTEDTLWAYSIDGVSPFINSGTIPHNMFIWNTYNLKNASGDTFKGSDFAIEIENITYLIDQISFGLSYDQAYFGIDANGNSIPLTVSYTFANVPMTVDVLLRDAISVQKDNDGNVLSQTQVYLMGKYIMTNNSDPIIYPAFSNILATGQASAIDLETGIAYSLDYTNRDNVIEGFPGVRLLAGAPYPNPILTLQLRHRANEMAGINLALDIKNAYYVELLATIMKNSETTLIQDFSTFAFKDTLTNLTQNDYINNIYQLLDAKTLNLVYGYIPDPEFAGNYIPFLTDAKGQAIPLTIQEIGINENDPYLYYANSLASDGKYKDKVYFYDEVSNNYYPAEYGKHVIIWETSPTKLENVPFFDIHSYSQGLDGFIYFNSGEVDDANSNCIGLEGIVGGATANTSYGFDYSKVLIGGTTSVYRSTTEFADASNSKFGYYVDKPVGIVNPYNSKDAYFLSGKESAVFVADPVVSLVDDNLGESYLYRFKEWVVYTRYNSEILYYNRGITEQLTDRYDAIMRFSSSEAGYFVILPVYERVYSLGLASEIRNGSMNIGGSISVQYDGGQAVDISGAQDKSDLYFTEFHETEENGQIGHFYGNIESQGFLVFDGTFRPYGDGTTAAYPNFVRANSSNVKYIAVDKSYLSWSWKKFWFTRVTQTEYYKIVIDADGDIQSITPVPQNDKLEPGVESIVPLHNANGVYTLKTYNGATFTADENDPTNQALYTWRETDPVDLKTVYYTADIDGVMLSEIMFMSHKSTYYYDGLVGDVNVDGGTDDMKDKTIDEGTYVPVFRIYDSISGKDEYYSIKATEFETKFKEGENYYTSIRSGKHIATAVTETFAGIKVIENPFIGGVRVNIKGSLSSGELAYENVIDEDGLKSEKLSQFLNFKNSYYDRDTTLTFTANADDGYVFDTWKIGTFNHYTQEFEYLDVSSAVGFEYSDLIIEAYHNTNNGTYYYITPYFEVGYNEQRTYYYDAEHTPGNEAVVPSSMLDEVRGIFVNDGTPENPNYVQVYLRGNGEYYYDQAYTREVSTYAPYKDADGNAVHREYIEMPYVDAIRTLYDSGNEAVCYLSNVSIFRVLAEPFTDLNGDGIFNPDTEETFDDLNGNGSYDGVRYYRSRSDGNILIEGNKVTIKKFHTNTRLVAVFKEVYDTYIFAEPETESGITVLGAYYYNIDKTTNDGAIRFDMSGENMTEKDSSRDTSLSILGDFANVNNSFYINMNTKKDNTTGKMSTQASTSITQSYKTQFTDPFAEPGTPPKDKYLITSPEVHTLLGTGTTTSLPGIGDNTPLYRITDGHKGVELEKFFVSLNDHYFVEDTVLYFVVNVKYGFDLSIHTLGMNPKWTLEPIMSPTKDFVKYNQTLSAQERADYTFYIFKMTYNRELDADNASLLNQSMRGESLVNDLLSGRNYEFYGEFYDLFDNFGNKLVLGTDWFAQSVQSKNAVNIRLSKSYTTKILNTLYDANTATNLANKFDDIQQPTHGLANSLEQFCEFLDEPKYVFVDGVKYSNSYQTHIRDNWSTIPIFNDTLPGVKDEDFVLMQSYYDIFTSIQNLSSADRIDPDNGNANGFIFNHSGPFFSSPNNFINLSTIVVYSFTVETVTLDGYTMIDGEEVPVTNTNAYHELLNTFYTAKGSNEYRYIGPGEESNLNNNIYYPTSDGIIFTHKVDVGFTQSIEEDEGKHPYVETASAYKFQNTPAGIRYEDFLLAENSLLLLGGTSANRNDTTPSAKEGYAFAGWYEQKFDKDFTNADGSKGAWTDLTLMSTEMTMPYVSIADADTKIIALYKRVIEVSYDYDPKQVTLSLGTPVDDLGNQIEYYSVVNNSGTHIVDKLDGDEHLTYTNGMIRVKGTFYFDTKATLTVTPVGGYRLDNIMYTVGEDLYNNGEIVGDAKNLLENAILPTAFELDSTSEFDMPIITRPVKHAETIEFHTGNYDDDGAPIYDSMTLSHYSFHKHKTTNNYMSQSEPKLENLGSDGDLYNKTVAQNITFKLFDHLDFGSDKYNIDSLANRGTDGDITDDTSTKLQFNFAVTAKAVKVVYLEVDGYNLANDQNFTFVLYDGNDGKIYSVIEQYKSSYEQKSDDAGYDPIVVYQETKASVTLYIDADTANSKDIKLATLKRKDLLQSMDKQSASIWYVNGYATETTTMPEFASGADLHTSPDVYGEKMTFGLENYVVYDLFTLSFAYGKINEGNPQTEKDYTYLNNSDFFDLNEANSIYYLYGRILENTTVTISHTVTDDVNNIAKKTLDVANDATSTLVYRGAMYDGNTVSGNGFISVKGQTKKSFSNDTIFDLTLTSKFIENAGKLYMFIGWFEIYVNEVGRQVIKNIALDGTTTQSGAFVNQNGSITGLKASSINTVFEARYVLVKHLELEAKTHGELNATAVNQTAIMYKDGATNVKYQYLALGSYDGSAGDALATIGERLVMNGSQIELSATPADGYIFTQFEFEFTNEPKDKLLLYSYDRTKVKYNEDTNTYVTNPKFKIEGSDTTIFAVFEQGIKIDVTQTLFATYQTAMDSSSTGTNLSNRFVKMSYGINALDGSYLNDKLNTQTATVAYGTKVKIYIVIPDTYFNTYTLVGLVKKGEMFKLGSDYDTYDQVTKTYELTFEFDALTEDINVEARFVRNALVDVSANAPDGSTLTSARFDISYYDFRIKDEASRQITIEDIAPGELKRYLPAGTLVTITDKTTFDADSQFEFVFMKKGGSVVSYAKTFTDTILAPSSNTTIDYTSHYEKVLKIILSKNIVAHDMDSAQLENKTFLSYFDIVVTYVNKFGTSIETELDFNTTTQIKVKVSSGTPQLTYKVVLDESVQDRYKFENMTYDFKDAGSPDIFEDTTKQVTLKNFNGSNNHTMTATFKPFNILIVAREVNGKEFTGSEKPNVKNTSNGSQIENDMSTMITRVEKNDTISLEIINDETAGYTFVGWYQDGILVSSDTSFSCTIDKPSRIVAKFNKLVKLNIEREINGEIVEHTSLPLYVSGLLSTDRTNIALSAFMLDGNNKTTKDDETTLYIQSGTTAVAVATHLAGYAFMGFKISDGTTEEMLSPEGASSSALALTATILFAGSPLSNGEYTLTAVYETEKTISYMTTFVGQSSTGVYPTVSGKNFFSKTNETVSVTVNYPENCSYKLRYFVVSGFDQDGNKTTEIVTSTENSTQIDIKAYAEQNIVIEAVFGTIVSVNVKIAVDDINNTTALNAQGVTATMLEFKHNTNLVSSVAHAGTNTYMTNLSDVFAGDTVTLSTKNANYSFKANGKTYYFTGYYVYDKANNSIATSLSPYTYDDTYTFVADRDIEIVMKYQQSETAFASDTRLVSLALNADGTVTNLIKTQNGFEAMTNNGSVAMTSEKGIYTLQGKTYAFVGYVQEVRDHNTTPTFVMISKDIDFDYSTSKLLNLTAIFVETRKTILTFAESINSSSFTLASYLRTHASLTPVVTVAGIDLYELANITESVENARYSFIFKTSASTATVTAHPYYYIDEAGTAKDKINFTLDGTTHTVNDKRATIEVVIESTNGEIQGTSATIKKEQVEDKPFSPSTGDENVKMKNKGEAFNITLSTNGENETIVAIVGNSKFEADKNQDTTIINVTNNTIISLYYETTASIASQLFVGYTLFATPQSGGSSVAISDTITDRTADLYLAMIEEKLESVSKSLASYKDFILKAEFEAKNTITLHEDSSFDLGTITTNADEKNHLNINTEPNVYIKDIIVVDGQNEYSVWSANTGFNATNANDFVVSITSSSSNQSTVSDVVFFTGMKSDWILKANTTVKVVLEKYFELSVRKVVNGSTIETKNNFVPMTETYSDTGTFNQTILQNYHTPGEGFVGFYYGGQKVTSDTYFDFEIKTTIEARYKQNLNLFVSAEIESPYESNKSGIVVYENEKTTAPFLNSSTNFTATHPLGTDGLTYITAKDNNGYYEFYGWYKGSVSEENLITDNAALVIDQDLIRQISVDDGSGGVTYTTLVASFKEIIRTMTVTTNYGDGHNTPGDNDPSKDIAFKVSIVKQGTSAETQTTDASYDTVQHLMRFDNFDNTKLIYKLAVQMVRNGSNSYLEITYPIAANKMGDSYTVIASNFKSVTYNEIEKFEYNDESTAQYYRFKNYTTSEGVISGTTDYSNKASLLFSQTNRSIKANAVKLYTIEFMTNFAHQYIGLYINAIKSDANGNVSTQTLSSIPQTSGSLSVTPNPDSDVIPAIMSYRVEEGQTIQVLVDYLEYAKREGATANYHPFNTIAFSKDPNAKLTTSFKAINAEYPDGLTLNATPLNTTEFWKTRFGSYFAPVSQIDAFTNTGANASQTENLSAFNFSVNTNVYFIADFLDAFGELRYYINNVISTSSPNSSYFHNVKDLPKDSLVFKTEDLVNHEFNFSFVMTPANTFITQNKNEYDKLGENSSYIYHIFDKNGNLISDTKPKDTFIDTNEDGIKNDDEEFEIDHNQNGMYDTSDHLDFTSSGSQTNFRVSEKMYTEIEIKFGVVEKANDKTKIDDETQTRHTDPWTEVVDSAVIESDTFALTIDTTKSVLESSATYYKKFGDTVTLQVNGGTTIRNGYYFKGFLVESGKKTTLINAAHDENNNSLQQKSLTTTSFLKSEFNQNSNEYTSSFKTEGNMTIIALYERKTIDITLNIYKFDKTSQEPLTHEVSNAGKVRGSLIAEVGKPLTLTAVSYSYAQFYGWTSEGNVTGYTNSGEAIPSEFYAGDVGMMQNYYTYLSIMNMDTLAEIKNESTITVKKPELDEEGEYTTLDIRLKSDTLLDSEDPTGKLKQIKKEIVEKTNRYTNATTAQRLWDLYDKGIIAVTDEANTNHRANFEKYLLTKLQIINTLVPCTATDDILNAENTLENKMVSLYQEELVESNATKDFIDLYQQILKKHDNMNEDDQDSDELNPIYSPTESLYELSGYTFNNLYLTNVSAGLEINVYFAPLEYKMHINLTEVLTGFNYDAGIAGSNGSTDSFITYSNEYIEKVKTENGGVWTNPSYSDGKYGISADSIYIYTFYDNTGKLIWGDKNNDGNVDSDELYPTKIMSQSIAEQYSHEAGIILLKPYNPDEYFPLITNINEGEIVKQFSSSENAKNSTHIITYLTDADDPLVKIKPYSTDFANHVLSNIYDFLKYTESGYQFVNGENGMPLFSMIINGSRQQKLDVSGLTLEFDADNSKISLVKTIVADEYSGFPTVRININGDFSKTILYGGFEIVGYEQIGKDKNPDKTSTTIQGFFNNLRTNVDDPSAGLPELEFDINLKYQYTANEVLATVNYSDFETVGDTTKDVKWSTRHTAIDGQYDSVYLTGKTSYANKYVRNATFTRNPGSDLDMFDHDQYPGYYSDLERESISSYDVYIVRQGRYIIGLLKDIINHPSILNAANGTKEAQVRQRAMFYISYIYGFSPDATMDQHYSPQTDKYYVFSTSNNDADFSYYQFISFMNQQYLITRVKFQNNMPGFLEFHKVDALHLYKSGVHYNYLSSYMNNGDAIIMSSKLREHAQGQIEKAGGWWGERPYTYYNTANVTWDYNLKTETHETTVTATEYSNVADLYFSDTKVDVEGWPSLDNYLAGLFNGSALYAGNFYNRVSACCIPDNEQFAENINGVTAIMTIVKNFRVKTRECDWFKTPYAIIAAEIAIFVAQVVVGAFTGGSGAVGIKLLIKIAKSAIKSAVKTLVMHALANAISIALNGKSLFENISNINFRVKPATVWVE